MRKVLTISYIIILCLVLFGGTGVYAIDDPSDVSGETGTAGTQLQPPGTPPSLSSNVYLLFETDRGQILYQKNADARLAVPMANKLMTALLAVESDVLDANVVISKTTLTEKKPVLDMEAGEKRTLEDLVTGMMLVDSSDAANAIAEYIGKDTASFIEMMNNKAHELGMKDTNFASLTGKEVAGDYTTAKDLSVLMKYASTKPAFNRIFSSEAKSWLSKNGYKILTNLNKMYWSYAGTDGGIADTYSVNDASLITSATVNNQRLFCLIIQAAPTTIYDDTTKLLNYGFNNFMTSLLVSKDSVLYNYAIAGKNIDLISNTDVYYTHPIGESYIDRVEYELNNENTLPITSTKILGKARYYLIDGTIIDINLFSNSEIYPPDNLISSLKKKLNENRDILVLLIVFGSIEAIIILYNLGKLCLKLFRNKLRNGSKQA